MHRIEVQEFFHQARESIVKNQDLERRDSSRLYKGQNWRLNQNYRPYVPSYLNYRFAIPFQSVGLWTVDP
ncbi:hypothetical protein NIES37_59370 [Tolypothrix tenuis PCC 7101]|uniref:Uncharacterized protein n=1 Tax=Tolypothrix tenuis PCC 7101 TaxID=231146 RepID=A0A1Z4N8A5_9CYAN|nr:hypothetical protein NIES37_59370 [Tolypothrix tenuis PCC 7101]BAZ74145.1 hypothetical protein NIES50_27160 [Aulosira laxa NIES-50]